MATCCSQLELGNFHKRDGDNHLNQEKEAKVSLAGRTAGVMVDGGSKISEKFTKLSVADEEHFRDIGKGDNHLNQEKEAKVSLDERSADVVVDGESKISEKITKLSVADEENCRDTDAVVDFKGKTSEFHAKRGRVSANLESHADSIDVNGKSSQIRAKGRRRNLDGMEEESILEAIQKIAASRLEYKSKCKCSERDNETLHDSSYRTYSSYINKHPSLLWAYKNCQPFATSSMLGEVKKSQPDDPFAFVTPKVNFPEPEFESQLLGVGYRNPFSP